jgi:transcriptional regulator with XRE-family HTH domain
MTHTPLKIARHRARLSALALADKAETTEPRVYALERGRYRPHTDEAERLATALGTTVADLFPGGTQPGGWQ